MRILKKFLRILTILLPCLVGVLFFTNNSYAVDRSITYNSGTSVSSWQDVFPDCSGDCLNDYSYLIVDISSPVLGNFSNGYNVPFISLYFRNDASNGVTQSIMIPYSFSNSIYFLSFAPGVNDGAHNLLEFYSSLTFSFDITFTLTDSLGGSAPSGSISITENGTYDVTSYAEAVVDVPVEQLPGDYDDEFNGVINAIYICGASAIMIYFFYMIYGIFIKPTGGNK